MIENLRKYTGLMIVALVAIFIGLTFFGNQIRNILSPGGAPYMRIGDRTYSVEDYGQLGERSLQVAGMMQMYMLVGQLGGDIQRPDPQLFFTNRMLLRQAQDQFGVHPSEAQILSYLRERSAFADPKTGFNQQAYNTFITREIGRYGLSEKNVHDLVGDYLAYEKLSELVGSGLLADRDYCRRAYADRTQALDLQVIEFPLSKYQGALNPTEDEVKEFWEEHKEAYTTEARRRFSYLVATPATPATPAAEAAEEQGTPAAEPAAEPATEPAAEPAAEPVPEPAADPATPGAQGDTGAPGAPAQPAPAQPAPAEPAPAAAPAGAPAAAPAPSPEEAARKAAAEAARKESERKLAELVDAFLGELDQKQGADFEGLAKEYGWEVKASEFFTRTSVPSDLNLQIRNGQPGRGVPFYLFDALTVTSDPLSKFSPAIPVSDGAWVLARLDEEEPSRTKTYEEARDEARAELIRLRSVESVKKDSEAAAKTLREALAAGKDFATAARESGLQPKVYDGFSTRGAPPEGLVDPAAVFDAACRTDPGAIADPLHLDDRSLLIFVTQRKLVREENLNTTIDRFADQEVNRNRFVAFDAWLAAGREQAKMLLPQG